MVTVAHKLTISNEFVKHWMPPTKTINGADFVQLSQWDRGFVKFCLGKGLAFQKGDSHKLHTEFYDHMRSRRSEVSTASFIKSRQSQGEDGQKRKKMKHRAARKSDALTAGEIQSVELMSGTPHAFTMRMLFDVKHAYPWIECTPENLTYVRERVLDDFLHGRMTRRVYNKNGEEGENGDAVDGDAEHDDDAASDEQ